MQPLARYLGMQLTNIERYLWQPNTPPIGPFSPPLAKQIKKPKQPAQNIPQPAPKPKQPAQYTPQSAPQPRPLASTSAPQPQPLAPSSAHQLEVPQLGWNAQADVFALSAYRTGQPAPQISKQLGLHGYNVSSAQVEESLRRQGVNVPWTPKADATFGWDAYADAYAVSQYRSGQTVSRITAHLCRNGYMATTALVVASLNRQGLNVSYNVIWAWVMAPDARIGWLGKGLRVSSDDRKGCELNCLSVDWLSCLILIQSMNLGAGVCSGGCQTVTLITSINKTAWINCFSSPFCSLQLKRISLVVVGHKIDDECRIRSWLINAIVVVVLIRYTCQKPRAERIRCEAPRVSYTSVVSNTSTTPPPASSPLSLRKF